MRFQHADYLFTGFRIGNAIGGMGKTVDIHAQLQVKLKRHMVDPYGKFAAVQTQKAVGYLLA